MCVVPSITGLGESLNISPINLTKRVYYMPLVISELVSDCACISREPCTSAPGGEIQFACLRDAARHVTDIVLLR